ncbi:DUF488 domain-containing protein [Cupriavidus taiwanensis]|uniref:DUF488 domain-containing protein n=1 Tax=Cupriavidus taiwanensis TaxID=164546 RepID=A0A375JD25_9BURK|nr:DUF488 domain-containing protein [Cupriavidus taiwanensis]SPS03074.1 conserved hypothetical protein [Cupriavidus taiwanensis]
MTRISTIGFTQKTAEHFFGLLQRERVRAVVDVRLNNISQLAGFAKRDDLRFFLRNVVDADYVELKELAPSSSILKAYQSKSLSWDVYAEKYLEELARRAVERNIEKENLDGCCLLCSEHSPERCHRRLALDYLVGVWGDGVEIKHLL